MGKLVDIHIMTFTWDSTNGIVGPTRPFVLDTAINGVSIYSVTGGAVTDLSGNLRMYYTDPDGYVSELVKHGY